MSASCEVELTIPFHDLDPLHVVWHGNYYKYFDIARFELFNSCGIDLYRYSQEKGYLFPLTRSSAKYVMPLHHNDRIVCRATVTEWQYKISMAFEIRRPMDRMLCAKGASDQVAVKLPDMELQYDIPADIQRALGGSDGSPA